MNRTLCSLFLLVAWLAGTSSAQQPAAARHAQLVIVVDGLRPDYVTPDAMPRLTRLGARGMAFTAHHSVFPTVTRVNAASFVTGAYPETHGLLGNTIYVPSAHATRGLDTGNYQNLELVARTEGRLLTAPSLGEILHQAGQKLFVVGSGSTGAVFVLNPTEANGVLVHQEVTRPAEIEARVRARFGDPAPHAVPNDAQNQRAIDVYLTIALEEVHPDVSFIWLSDPDTTAHATGIGSPQTRRSLALVDAGIGRIEDALAAKGLLSRTNIIVTSDHGFSTHTSTLKLGALVEPFARKMDDGTPDIVVAEGAVYFRQKDEARVAAVVAALQQESEVGAIFTRPRMPDSARGTASGNGEGTVPGTLSFDVVRWNHARSGDILVAANWSAEKNAAGFEGKSTQSGVAGHGTSSPYDIHNTLIAAGPDFREHAVSQVPTGNVDVAPTLLHLLGVRAPATMTGRVIAEALRDGPEVSSVAVRRFVETVKVRDGSYEVSAHFSTAGPARYLDFTEVTRR